MKHLTFLAAALSLAGTITLQAATLKVGDPAPKLQAGKWMQGDPVKNFDKDHAYIVEFWATWCGPCVASIPHLNEIYTKYKSKGLVVIGQNVWERDEDKVKPFIEKMGDKMTYRVALDDKSTNDKGAMAETWMQAADQNGIPAAFLVDKQGKIAWIGHPMQLKETVIEAVLAGNYDMKKAVADAEKQKQLEDTQRKLSMELNKHVQAKEWDKAEAALEEIAKALPEEQRAGMDGARLQIAIMSENNDRIATLANRIADKEADPQQLNQIAWMLATSKGTKGAVLDAALKVAEKANTASGGKEAAILDTLARVTFMKGNKEKAIELQQKAVDLAEADLKEDLEATLKSYKDGKLPEIE